MRAAAYARYSTEHQTGNSIAYQLNAIRKYCAENNIDVTATYCDEAQSGTNTDREGFLDLVAAAGRKEFDAVVIYDISRGSRDVADWFDFRKAMSRLGIQVIAVENSLGDVLNPNDFLTELISVGLGQHQVLTTRQKSIAGMAERAKKGLFCGGTPPLGYDVTPDKNYAINEREAASVRTIFRMYAAGKSYGQIIDALDGATGKNGRPLGKNSLNSILKNEKYLGTYEMNKHITRVMRKCVKPKPNPNYVRIEGRIPPIIDETTWERVQYRMSTNKKSENKAKREYLLTGLIECSACGANYVGHTSTSRGVENQYYVCGNKYRTHTCKAQNLNCPELDVFIRGQVEQFFEEMDIDATAQMVADQYNAASADLEAERRELAEVETQIHNGVKHLLGGWDCPELHDEVDKLRQRKEELTAIIGGHGHSNAKMDAKKLAEIMRRDAAEFKDHPKEIIRRYITKIYADPDGTFTVGIGVHIMAPQVGLEPTAS